MINTRIVTVWIVFSKSDGRWSFNHFEDGDNGSDTPTDRFNVGWSKQKWRKQVIEVLDEICPKINFDKSLLEN